MSGVCGGPDRVHRPDRPGPGPGGRAARPARPRPASWPGPTPSTPASCPGPSRRPGSSPRPWPGPGTRRARWSRSRSAGSASSTPARPTASTGRTSAPGSAIRTGTPTRAGDRPGGGELDRVRQPGVGHPRPRWPPATRASWSWWPATPGWSRRRCWPSCPVVGGTGGARMKLRTQHASLTTWEVDGGGVEADRLQRRGPPPGDRGGRAATPGRPAGSGRSWMTVGTGVADTGFSRRSPRRTRCR